jgi:hypothetical protein
MKTSDNNKSLELRLYLTNYRDGLFDMVFAMMLIISGMNQLFTFLNLERPIYLKLGILIVLAIFLLVKRFVSYPRSGKVIFSKGRKKKRAKALIITIAAQVVTAVVLYAAVKNLLPVGEHSQLVSLIIEFLFLLVVFSSIAYFTDYKWFYFIGIIIALAWPVNYLLQPVLNNLLPGIILQLSAGGFLLTVGTVKLTSFLRKYPKPGRSVNYENQ